MFEAFSKEVEKVITKNRSARGRPTLVPKSEIISYILFQRQDFVVYRDMELEGDFYLDHKYDHSNYWYHYDNLEDGLQRKLVKHLAKIIKSFVDTTMLHLLDSSYLSTSVRTERLRAGTRVKTKLTDKFHTLIGYNPPEKIIYVEDCLATDHHTSDSQGGIILLQDNELVGYIAGDSAYETYELVETADRKGLFVVIVPSIKRIKKTFSPKNKWRKCHNERLRKEIRGSVESVYGGATRRGIILTNSVNPKNRRKDSNMISIRQNFYTILRLKALARIIRQTLLKQ